MLIGKYATDFYVLFLWLLCGVALDSLFQAWWPWQRVFWSGVWTGGLLIALLAAVVVRPAATALEFMWGRLSEKSN